MARLFRGHIKFNMIESIGANLGFGDFQMPWGQSPGKGYAKRFFVDPTNGSDSNDGRSWRYPFATFEKGIDSCRFPHGETSLDYDDKSVRSFLFLAPGHYNEGAEMLFSGYNISVIGCGIPVPGKDYGVSINYDGATAATAAMGFSGSGIEICGLHIYCAEAIPAFLIAGGDNNYIHDCVIECDGTNATYGIHANSMKGSWIERVTICGSKTAAIYMDGGADRYCIDGGIRDCRLYSGSENTTGILLDVDMTCHNFWVDRNLVALSNGSSCKGIDINATGGVCVVDNYVSVPASATPIEHAGGDQFLMGNHTAAGTVNVDPNPAAG